MGRGNKRKPLVPPPMASLRRARAVTSSFHRLTAELAEASAAGRRADAARVSLELEQLGGCGLCRGCVCPGGHAECVATARRRAAYQEASALTTARHRTAKFVFSALTRHGLRPARGEPPLPLLEVGAVNTQLLSVPWLATRAIDLRSTHPRIEQLDFFSLAPAAEYGAVVCAMVLNCVPDALARGAMLRGLREHLRPGGLCFVMLPLRCVAGSPFTTRDTFAAALAAAGLEARARRARCLEETLLSECSNVTSAQVLETKESPKVVFICARAAALPDAAARRAAAARFRDPPAVVARGAELTNQFAVAFAPP